MVPGEWTPVYAPCEIGFGGARLFFGPAPGPAPSAAAPPKPPASQPFVPRVQEVASTEDETRIQPIEEIQASRRTLEGPSNARVAAAPSFGAPPPAAPTFGAPPGPMGPGPQLGPGMPSMVLPAPGAVQEPPSFLPPKKKEPQGYLAARWREASGPKKALMVLMLPLLWAVWVIFTDKPPAPSPPPPASATTASASASAADTAEPMPAQEPSATPSASPGGKGAKTLPREAADAVAVGAYDKAARLYEGLAKAHPEVPAYAEAARIMRAKAGRR